MPKKKRATVTVEVAEPLYEGLLLLCSGDTDKVSDRVNIAINSYLLCSADSGRTLANKLDDYSSKYDLWKANL